MTIERNDALRMAPGLALSWRAVNDTTWEFKLHPGVTFHGGSPFHRRRPHVRVRLRSAALTGRPVGAAGCYEGLEYPGEIKSLRRLEGAA